jgi:flagellar protein FlgJ
MKIDNLNMNMTIENAKTAKSESEVSSFEKVLEEAAKNGDDEKLRETCEAFESIFLNMMLSTMRKTIPDGELVEKSNATSTFESMLDEEYSKTMAKAGGIGLADVLYKQLSSKYK